MIRKVNAPSSVRSRPVTVAAAAHDKIMYARHLRPVNVFATDADVSDATSCMSQVRSAPTLSTNGSFSSGWTGLADWKSSSTIKNLCLILVRFGMF